MAECGVNTFVGPLFVLCQDSVENKGLDYVSMSGGSQRGPTGLKSVGQVVRGDSRHHAAQNKPTRFPWTAHGACKGGFSGFSTFAAFRATPSRAELDGGAGESRTPDTQFRKSLFGPAVLQYQALRVVRANLK